VGIIVGKRCNKLIQLGFVLLKTTYFNKQTTTLSTDFSILVSRKKYPYLVIRGPGPEHLVSGSSGVDPHALAMKYHLVGSFE